MSYNLNPFTRKLDDVGTGGVGGGIAASIPSGNTAGAMALISSGTMYLMGGNNVTLSQNANSITISGGAAGGADGINAFVVNGGISTASTTLALSNFNNVSFGLNAGTITASASYSTLPKATNVNDVGTAGVTGVAASYAPSDHVHAGVVRIAAGSNTGNTLGDTIAKHGNWIIAGTNGVTISGSTGGASNTAWISVATNYQSQGAYLTTARASNDAVGLNTAVTNVTATINSSGFSFNAGGYAGTGTSATNASVTLNSNGLAISVANPGVGGGAYVAGMSNLGNTSGTTGVALSSLYLAGGNGVTLSQSLDALSSGGTITMSVKTDYQSSNANYLTSQSNQALSGSNGSFAFQTATFGSSNGMHFYTTNGSLVGSYTVPTQSTQPVAASASNGSFNFSTLKFVEGSGVTWATQANGVQASVRTDYASSSASNVSGVVAATASNGATNQTAQLSGNVSFANGSGVSFFTTASGATSGIAASVKTDYQSSGAYLTTAMASNRGSDFVAATAAFAGTNASGTIASNGISVSVNAGGGVTPAVSNSAGSFTFSTLNFSNANNVTFGTSAGGIVTASVAAPGAAAENNWFALTGANTAGNTTASGSTIGLSGINLTLSGTNGSGINISAPATSSLAATGQVSISTNGSTISIGVANPITLNSHAFGIDLVGGIGSVSLGQNSLYFFPDIVDAPIQGSIIKFPVNITLSSSGAGAFTRGHTASFAAYSRSATGANSTALTLLYSTSYTAAAVMSSNANMSISVITAVGNSTSYSTVAANSAGLNLSLSVHGGREFIMPFNTTMTAGEYWFAFAQSSSSAGGVGNVFNVSNGVMTYSSVNRMGLSTAASNDGIQKNIGMGTYSATSGAFPNSLPLTDIRGGATWPVFYFLQGTV